MKGHNGKVINLLWSNGDANIISCDEDGIIYRWDVSSGVRVEECVRYRSSPDIDYVIRSPDKIWIFTGSRVDCLSAPSLTFDSTVQEEFKGKLGAVLSSHETPSFCIATIDTQQSTVDPMIIRIYDMMTEGHVDIPIRERASSMSLSSDDKVLILGFESGDIIAYNLTDNRGSSALLTEGPHTGTLATDDWSTNVLVSDIFLQEKDSIVMDLSNCMKELKEDFEYRVGIRKMSNGEDVSRLEEDYNKAVDRGSLIVQALQDEISSVNRKHGIESRNQCGLVQAATYQVEREHKSQMLDVINYYSNEKKVWSEQIKDRELEEHELAKRNKAATASTINAFKGRLQEEQAAYEKTELALLKTKAEQREIMLEIEDEVGKLLERYQESIQITFSTH